MRDAVQRRERARRQQVRECRGARLPIRPADHDELAAAGDPALDAPSLRLGEAGAVGGPDERRDAVQRLGALGDVGGADDDRLRGSLVDRACHLRPQGACSVTDDGHLRALLQDAELGLCLHGAVRLLVLDGDASLERLRLDVEHDDLAGPRRHLHEALDGAAIGGRREVALGRLAVVHQRHRHGQPATDLVAPAHEGPELDLHGARGACRHGREQRRKQRDHERGEHHGATRARQYGPVRHRSSCIGFPGGVHR